MRTTMGPVDIVGYLVLLLFAAFGVALVYQAVKGVRQARHGDGVEQCEKCGYDLRASTDRCPECGAQTRHAYHESLRRLRDDWPSAPVAPRIPAPDETPVSVFVARDEILAALLCKHLTARGIATEYARARPIGRSGRTVLYSSDEIFVWSGDEELARRVLADLCPPELLAESARLAST